MFGVRAHRATPSTTSPATGWKPFGPGVLRAVDVVSGIGWDKIDPDNPAYRFVNVFRVVSNLGVFDFGGPGHSMRAVSLHPCRARRRSVRDIVRGVRARRGAADPIAERRGAGDHPPDRPEGVAGQGSQAMRIRTALTRLVGIEHPVVQTGMGWVAGARLVSATANAGGLGILASATMTIDELATAIAKVKSATDRPFGVNIRADAADAADRVDLMIREHVKVASFALAPKPELIARLKDAASVVIPSVGAANMPARLLAGVRTRLSSRVARAAGTPDRWPPRCCCPQCSTPSRAPASRPSPQVAFRRSWSGRRSLLRRRRRGDGHPVSPHVGLHGPGCGQAALPARRPGRDGGIHPRRRYAAPGLRTGLVEKLESGSRIRVSPPRCATQADSRSSPG